MKKEIRVALIGHQFMGIAHSNAFRNANMWIDLPVKIVLKCLCANYKPFSLDFNDGVECQKILDAVERSSVERKWLELS